MIPFRQSLIDASEPKLAEFNSKLVPGKENILGVRMPAIRRIASQIIKDGWEQVLEGEPQSHEEEILRAIIIAQAPVSTKKRIELTDSFLQYVDNWAVCDALCQSWKLPEEDIDQAWEYFSSLIDTDQEYPMRVSVVARMSLFKDREHQEQLLEDIVTHDHPGYYYRMGAAWAVSMIYVEHPETVEEAFGTGRMEPWTQNKAVQKIRESLQVPKDQKEDVKRFRRSAP